MSWFSRNPPDLAIFNDLDAVLNKIGDITVREPVRQYYRILYYVQQIRSAKWCLFALFITLFFEFQINVLFPASKQTQAVVALVISFVVLGALWSLEYATFLYGGDPADLFETRDEEMAIAHELGHIALNALPVKDHISPAPPIANSKLGALFEMPECSSDGSSGEVQPWHAKGECAPLAKIHNSSATRSPVLCTLPKAYRPAHAGMARQVRAGLLNFNASLLGSDAEFSSLKRQ